MKLLTPETGPEEPSEETLTENERYAVNEVCRQVFEAWQLAPESNCDFTDLMLLLNGGIARAIKMVREKGLG